MPEHLSTMTVDVGKHVMRICHTDYDQHTGNDYCLIVAFWSSNTIQDFSILFKQKTASVRIKNDPSNPQQQKFHDTFLFLFFFYFKKKRYQQKFWHLIARLP